MIGICHFCGAKSLNTCRWPVFRFQAARYKDVKVGDRVRRYADRDRSIPRDRNRCFEIKIGSRRAVAVVGSMEPWPTPTTFTVYPGTIPPAPWSFDIEFRIKGVKGWRTKETRVRASSMVLVERGVPCGLVCCQNHCVERGEKLIYCASHWSYWEQVA